MGAFHSNRSPSFDASGEVDFDHFQILRAIGKGAFGKVCIVQKKDTKKMFAMKYMNKCACIKKDAIDNVLRELEILQYLEHPFIVNLWFTFQDEEDMFMVVDLLLGGDIRYHLQQGQVKFDEKRVTLYLCELGLALEYLRTKHIVHRDLKPDNLLLDEKGHVHLTDFNIATILDVDELATSMSGTKPYMAPEVFAVASGDEIVKGYSFAVDWWSLGVCLFEILNRGGPYEIHSTSNLLEIRQMFTSSIVQYSSTWSTGMRRLLRHLLNQEPSLRLQTMNELKKFEIVKDVDWESVERMELQPAFVPPKDHLNCDPTFELEEMIIEANPLHKKKKRLAKQNSKTEEDNNNPYKQYLDKINSEFRVYNREKPILEDEVHNNEEYSSTIETLTLSDDTKLDKNALKLDQSVNGNIIQVKEHSEQNNTNNQDCAQDKHNNMDKQDLTNGSGHVVDLSNTNR